MRRVRNDRLLMSLLAHLKYEAPPRTLAPANIDDVEDKRGTAAGTLLAAVSPAATADASPAAASPPARVGKAG